MQQDDGRPLDRLRYRDAMARLGAAVSVVTTMAADGPCGFTASAICSVTDEPPTLLVCMNRNASQYAHFVDGGCLCVNALAADQQPLSERFAAHAGGSAAARFDPAAWDVLATGAPALRDALVSFDCRITDRSVIGTHSVMFCRVEAVRLGEAPAGLIYFDRAYHQLPALAAITPVR